MANKKVLVIGDGMLDVYVYGDVERISPECPVPVLDYRSERTVLGGALNVAANIKSIGEGQIDVEYFGYYSDEVLGLLTAKGIGASGAPAPMMTKTRFVSNRHQLLRVDNFLTYNHDCGGSINVAIKEINLEEYDLVVVSDYNKSTITSKMWDKIFLASVPRIIDLKIFRKSWNILDEFDDNNLCIKCNEIEWDSVLDTRRVFAKAKYVVTRGRNGHSIISFDDEVPDIDHASLATDDELVDVVGAGDAFAAGMAVEYLESGQFDVEKMASFGAVCAAAKIRKFGTAEVRSEDI